MSRTRVSLVFPSFIAHVLGLSIQFESDALVASSSDRLEKLERKGGGGGREITQGNAYLAVPPTQFLAIAEIIK